MMTSAADTFRSFAHTVSMKVGSPAAFIAAALVVLVWAASGPFFHFNDTWELVINTATTIVTFLMVFLIQATQNRDSRTLHLKLDELIRVTRARNHFAALEEASEEELAALELEFQQLCSRKRTAAAELKELERQKRLLKNDSE